MYIGLYTKALYAPIQELKMELVGKFFLFLGFAIAALAQFVGAILVFRFSILNGILSLIVPGYIIVAIKKVGLYKLVVGSWLVGVVLSIIGVVMLS